MGKVILYARVSTDEQALSLDGQLRELRDHARKAGLEVVAVVEDRGEKRRTLERPGIEEIMGYAEAGAMQEVWAWSWDRFGEYPVPEMLAMELEDFGVTLRSLDDGGEGEDAEDMRIIKSLFSRREGRTRVRRSKRGMADKAIRGEVFGGFRARYGFEFVTALNPRGREVNVGYVVDEGKMAVVRRILQMIADGESYHAVQRELEQGGILNPSGRSGWSRTTIRNIVFDDVYRPHSGEEVAELVGPRVRGLEPDREYGIHWSGRRRSRFASSRGKKRVVYETPREEWTAIPVDLSGSGLRRDVVDKARAAVADNRSPSKVEGRFWELSGGLLKCAECGRNMISYRRAKKSGHNYYYRCRPSGTLAACPNRKSHPAAALEAEAWELLRDTVGNPGRLLEELERQIEERTGSIRRGASREHLARLVGELEKLNARRASFQDQAAAGLMTLPELRQRLDAIEDQRAAVESQLEASRDTARQLQKYESARMWLSASIMAGQMSPEDLTPEQRHAEYKKIAVGFKVDGYGNLSAEGRITTEGEGPESLQLDTTG